MNVVEEIKKLGLPLENIIVVGGATLVVRGIRSSEGLDDIDLIITQEIFDNLKQTGEWQSHTIEFEGATHECLLKGVFDIGTDYWHGTGADYLIKNNLVDVIDGVMFQSLPEYIRGKTIKGTSRDLADVAMVADYFKKQFEQEFPIVYEWHDEPGVVYENHTHQGKVSLYVTKGSVTFSGGIEKAVVTGERFGVPPGITHSAVVGPEGCDYIVGQEIEGDA